jgi:hypothetical protein
LVEATDPGRILAAAAKRTLAPLGFRRKGRSRVWLADRGFWLSVVEFQPSHLGKGSYLNVAAHWLWGAMPDVLSFDYFLERPKLWIEFRDEAQFKPLAQHLVEQAAEESRHLETRIATLAELAVTLVARETSFGDRAGGWTAFDTAVASALVGDMQTANRWFALAYDSFGGRRPDLQALLIPYAEALTSVDIFVRFITDRIDTRRASFGLAPLSLADRARAHGSAWCS